MATLTSTDRSYQFLIEARLDAIERILMDCRVARGERHEIVQAVESQIYEMLAEEPGEPTRESVLTVLRSLDPPEAYCQEVRGEWSATWRPGPRSEPMEATANGRNATSRTTSGLAITAFVLALLSVPAFIIPPLGGLIAFASAIFALFGMYAIASSNGRVGGMWMTVVSFVFLFLHYIALFAMLLA